jgi:DNA-directed RNA polymerase subunit beta
MYEAIVKGENILEPGLPESFNVMCKELKSLGLEVELVEREAEVAETTDEETVSAEVIAKPEEPKHIAVPL